MSLNTRWSSLYHNHHYSYLYMTRYISQYRCLSTFPYMSLYSLRSKWTYTNHYNRQNNLSTSNYTPSYIGSRRSLCYQIKMRYLFFYLRVHSVLPLRYATQMNLMNPILPLRLLKKLPSYHPISQNRNSLNSLNTHDYSHRCIRSNLNSPYYNRRYSFLNTKNILYSLPYMCQYIHRNNCQSSYYNRCCTNCCMSNYTPNCIGLVRESTRRVCWSYAHNYLLGV